MVKIGKRLKQQKQSIDIYNTYTIKEAIEILKSNSKVKFDETIDVSVKLGIDPKQSSQMVRGVAAMPSGTGKTVKVAVISNDAKQAEAKEAGADLVGGDEIIDDISAGKINFDKLVVTPDVMSKLGKVAKILGPKGLMPNPKVGTVTMKIKEAVETLKSGQVEFRTEKGAIIHAPVGKVSFTTDALIKNIQSLIDALNKSKPAASKGVYLSSMHISSTMGVGLKVLITSIE